MKTVLYTTNYVINAIRTKAYNTTQKPQSPGQTSTLCSAGPWAAAKAAQARQQAKGLQSSALNT